ncbi:hypothetical protein OH76DRAFT_1402839 [Lentinus brumalis]|uniref:Fungal calcium binding protein domain-containing protein n=1 Tax=Lentinus brumalis TaxID=2498619 RepID=A0A371DCU0_9APHY|nr:hypothetical protein OH76DRAFT_1402839 [Polyporus brumalis]
MRSAIFTLVAGFVASSSAAAVKRESDSVHFCVDFDFQGNCKDQIVELEKCIAVDADFDNKISSFEPGSAFTFCALFDDAHCQQPIAVIFSSVIDSDSQNGRLDPATTNDRASSFECADAVQ